MVGSGSAATLARSPLLRGLPGEASRASGCWPAGAPVIAYHLLKNPNLTHTDLGADYSLRHKRTAVMRHHVQQLVALGYRVTLDPAA